MKLHKNTVERFVKCYSLITVIILHYYTIPTIFLSIQLQFSVLLVKRSD